MRHPAIGQPPCRKESGDSGGTRRDSVETVAAWDSVRHLQLVLAIEEQFGMSFEAEMIPALTSVRAIASAIEAHRAAAGA